MRWAAVAGWAVALVLAAALAVDRWADAEIGSLADWLGAVGTTLAVGVSAWVFHHERTADRRQRLAQHYSDDEIAASRLDAVIGGHIDQESRRVLALWYVVNNRSPDPFYDVDFQLLDSRGEVRPLPVAPHRRKVVLPGEAVISIVGPVHPEQAPAAMGDFRRWADEASALLGQDVVFEGDPPQEIFEVFQVRSCFTDRRGQRWETTTSTPVQPLGWAAPGQA